MTNFATEPVFVKLPFILPTDSRKNYRLVNTADIVELMPNGLGTNLTSILLRTGKTVQTSLSDADVLNAISKAHAAVAK